jgi:hypothetical protein
LQFLGHDPLVYEESGVYEPQTEPAFDFEHLAHFIDVLNNSPNETFEADIRMYHQAVVTRNIMLCGY